MSLMLQRKKRKNRSLKIEAKIIKHKFKAVEKKRKEESMKSNVAQKIENMKKKHNSNIKRKTVNKMKKTKSIRFKTIEKKKMIKSIVMHVNTRKSCVRITRRRVRCLRRFLLRCLL